MPTQTKTTKIDKQVVSIAVSKRRSARLQQQKQQTDDDDVNDKQQRKAKSRDTSKSASKSSKVKGDTTIPSKKSSTAKSKLQKQPKRTNDESNNSTKGQNRITNTKRKRMTKTTTTSMAALVSGESHTTQQLVAEQTRTVSTASSQQQQLSTVNSLPRTIEYQLRTNVEQAYRYVIGIDEAGRGPLAGPVVAAAVMLPDYMTELQNNNFHDLLSSGRISGIVDSKKVTDEKIREELYEKIISLPDITWAVAIVDATKIDEINILQATLLGMKSSAMAVMGMKEDESNVTLLQHEQSDSSYTDPLYVVVGSRRGGESVQIQSKQQQEQKLNPSDCYALIDGNKIPKSMPCEAESVIKGDGKEYIIAVASILAKVTRDRLMHQYDHLYPEYNFRQHKGYPTASHMSTVQTIGATPIHRRTFAPLKHMTFDEDGRIVTNKK